jgi:hypothetical protein
MDYPQITQITRITNQKDKTVVRVPVVKAQLLFSICVICEIWGLYSSSSPIVRRILIESAGEGEEPGEG